MRYSPEYPIIERRLTRVKSRRRSRRHGSSLAGARSSRQAHRPRQQRAAALVLAALIMAAAMAYLMLAPAGALRPPGAAQLTSSLGALFGQTATR